MNVADSLDDLLEQDLGEGLVALLPLPHEIEQVTAGAKLHDKHDVALRFKSLVELDDGLVSKAE